MGAYRFAMKYPALNLRQRALLASALEKSLEIMLFKLIQTCMASRTGQLLQTCPLSKIWGCLQ